MAGKKDKKKVDKKTRVAEKTARKTAQKEKKNTKKGKNQADDEPEDVDLDQVLEEYARQQAQFHKVTETPLSAPPPVRANATLTASPNGKELFLFGGETFNGSIARFFNELYIFNADREDWRQITSPNSPLPRSGHFVTGSQHGGAAGSLWLFGGEFSSPKQGTFYHYNDFWRFDCATREWTRVETKGTGKAGGTSPQARSGHRMVAWKSYILLMGGFQDTSTTPKYLADLWVFDTVNYTWTLIALPAHAQRPEARSSFSLLPHEQGAVIYGGYARVKTSSVTASSGKKGARPSSRSVTYKPVMYQDTWLLRMDSDLTKVRWERRKKPGNPPNPPRVGVTMAWHKGRGILFGGVRDEEDTEESLDSEFFSDLFAWGTDRNRFFPLVLRKPRVQQKRAAERGGGGRRGRAKEDEEELLRNLAALEATGKMAVDTDAPVEMDIDVAEKKAPVELSLEMPHRRFNCAMAVLDDVLYGYGGTFEKGDREFMFDEMFSIDLGRLDGVRAIFSRKDETIWEDSASEDDDDDDDDDDDEEDEDEMDIDEGVEEAEKIIIDEAEIEARRKEKAKRKKEKGKEPTPTEPSEPPKPSPEEEEEEEELPIDEAHDPTPHPRPFEALREFFARTSTAWQDLLIAQQQEALTGGEKTKTIKELRKAAFSVAEDKWWACREEIRALEDEQEEAGIGEVVNLGDMAGGGGGGGGGSGVGGGGGGVGRRR